MGWGAKMREGVVFRPVLLGLFFTTTLFLLFSGVNAQPRVLWNRTLGGESAEFANCIVEAGNQGFVLAGASDYFPAAWRVDSAGNVVWKKTYSTGPLADYWQTQILSVAPSRDGGYLLVLGRDRPSVNGGSLIMKIDGDGNKVWEVAYGGANSTPVGIDWAERGCIAPTRDGGFVVGGEGWYVVRVDPEGGRDLTGIINLVKINGDGQILWNRSYHDEKAIWVRTVLEARDGSILLLMPNYLMKVDYEGNKIWSRSYEPRPGTLSCMARGADGSVVIAGYTFAREEVALLKIDSDGDKVWERYHWAGGGYAANHIAGTRDGGFLVVGDTKPFDDEEGDVFVLKVDREGEKEWLLTYGEEGCDRADWVIPTGDGGFMVAGRANSFDDGRGQVLLLRIEGRPFADLVVMPSRVTPGLDASLLLQATLRIPSPGWGTIASIWANLSSLDHSEVSALYDDGKPSHGDHTRGDGIFSALVSIKPGLSGGRKAITVHLVDDKGRFDMMRGYLFVHPRSSQIVYEEGYEDWSPVPGSAYIDLLSHKVVYAGNVSMTISIPSGGFVDFVPPWSEALHTFGYTSIDLALNPGQCTRFFPRLYLGIEGEESLEQISLSTQDSTFPKNKWTYVSVPLADIDAVNKSITFIRIGGYFDSVFHIDNFHIKSEIPETPRTPISAGVIIATTVALLRSRIAPARITRTPVPKHQHHDKR